MKNFMMNGVSVHFVERNHGQALGTLVFIHGNSHSLKTFQKQMDSEELSKYHLFFLDLPGHGESSKWDNYSLTSIAKLLNAFILEMNLKNVILVGHSLGGHVAINMIAENLKATSGMPQRPVGVFLFGTPPLTNPFDPNAFLPNDRASALRQEISSDLEIESFMGEMNYEGEDKLRAVSDYKKTDLKFRTSILADILLGTNENEVDTLKTYDGQTMFLLASEDSLIDNSYISSIFSGDEGQVHFKEIAAGHSPHVEKPGEFNLILNEFCENILSESLVNNERAQREHGHATRNA